MLDRTSIGRIGESGARLGNGDTDTGLYLHVHRNSDSDLDGRQCLQEDEGKEGGEKQWRESSTIDRVSILCGSHVFIGFLPLTSRQVHCALLDAHRGPTAYIPQVRAGRDTPDHEGEHTQCQLWLCITSVSPSLCDITRALSFGMIGIHRRHRFSGCRSCAFSGS